MMFEGGAGVEEDGGVREGDKDTEVGKY